MSYAFLAASVAFALISCFVADNCVATENYPDHITLAVVSGIAGAMSIACLVFSWVLS